MKFLNNKMLILPVLGLFIFGTNELFCAAKVLSTVPEIETVSDLFKLISSKDLSLADKKEAIKALRDKAELNIDVPNENDETPLMVAVKNNDTELTKLILTKNPNVNLVDSDGWSPLMAAIENLNEVIVQLLLCAGADINIQTKRLHLTAMQQAKAIDNKKILDLLIDYKKNGPISKVCAIL